MIGKCVNSLITGTACKSNVFLVYDSNVLTPLSHRMTFGFPLAMIYSADMIHSWNVALNPLFNKIGFFVAFPTFFNKSKFCMFLAPI